MRSWGVRSFVAQKVDFECVRGTGDVGVRGTSLPLCTKELTEWDSACDMRVDIFLPTIVSAAAGRETLPTAGHGDPQ
jgi:hypothetical protein